MNSTNTANTSPQSSKGLYEFLNFEKVKMTRNGHIMIILESLEGEKPKALTIPPKYIQKVMNGGEE